MPDARKNDPQKSDPQKNDRCADLDALVERWFFESFHGSIVARATDVWNHVHAAKDELKARLVALTTDTV